ncbi:hypothetical protein E0H75_19965 [Kribbella capetownensis]|uniref:SnoaL-like domain-containing protein n=1 Tax=Kribbella capetownensis TaxID=1572659 RepID=A0A4R0JUK6_9ACTN|nr:ester cyclase [Kribbella capetownensis]TCC48848.1 hypothetical protein E0H75_19965 [Kribbella capetownensis]
MSNVELHKQAHRAMTEEGAEQTATFFAPDIVFTDHAQGVTMKGKEETTGWLAVWKTAFSDAAVTEGTYLDAGDWTIARFQARGHNDGEFAGLPATGREVDFPCCELIRWQDGKSVEGAFYYDTMTVLVQLGHVTPPGS